MAPELKSSLPTKKFKIIFHKQLLILENSVSLCFLKFKIKWAGDVVE